MVLGAETRSPPLSPVYLFLRGSFTITSEQDLLSLGSSQANELSFIWWVVGYKRWEAGRGCSEGEDWWHVWKVPLRWHMHYIYKKHPALILFFFPLSFVGDGRGAPMCIWDFESQVFRMTLLYKYEWVLGKGERRGFLVISPSSSVFSQKTVVGSYYMLSITAFGSVDVEFLWAPLFSLALDIISLSSGS